MLGRSPFPECLATRIRARRRLSTVIIVFLDANIDLSGRGPALAIHDMLDEQMKENDALHQIELACRTYEKGVKLASTYREPINL